MVRNDSPVVNTKKKQGDGRELVIPQPTPLGLARVRLYRGRDREGEVMGTHEHLFVQVKEDDRYFRLPVLIAAAPPAEGR